MSNVYEQYIDSLYEDPFNESDFNNFYAYLKLNVVPELDSLLDIAKPETRLQYIDALTYCYLRRVEIDRKKVIFERPEYIQVLFEEPIQNIYSECRYMLVEYESFNLITYSDRGFIVSDELLPEHFKPVLVYSTKRIDEVYYSHDSTFHPVQVAVDSLVKGSMNAYKKWLYQYARFDIFGLKSDEYLEFNIIEQGLLGVTELGKRVDFKYDGRHLYLDKNLFELHIEKCDIQKIKCMFYVEDNLKFILFRRKNIDLIRGILDLDNSCLILPDERSIIHLNHATDGCIKRKFLFGNV